MSLRSTAVLAAAALLAAAAGGCGVTEADTSRPGYVQAGEAFWDDWAVPEGTVLLGTPVPQDLVPQQEGLPENPDAVSAQFLLTEDPYTAVRDLAAQIGAHGLRVVAAPDAAACGVDGVFACAFYGVGGDGLTKVAASFVGSANPDGGDAYPRLDLEIGAWTPVFPRSDAWVDFIAPDGESGFDMPKLDAADLESGTEVPLIGRDEVLGEVPEGARLLAPLYNPSATYGVHAVFFVEDEAGLADIEAMALAASTGERYPDADPVSGDLVAHRISYDGSAGGCGVVLTSVPTGDAVIAVLEVVCD